MKMRRIKTGLGSLPVVSACPANANGYGPHETDAVNDDGDRAILALVLDDVPVFHVAVCMHCAALFATVVKDG